MFQSSFIIMNIYKPSMPILKRISQSSKIYKTIPWPRSAHNVDLFIPSDNKLSGLITNVDHDSNHD